MRAAAAAAVLHGACAVAMEEAANCPYFSRKLVKYLEQIENRGLVPAFAQSRRGMVLPCFGNGLRSF